MGLSMGGFKKKLLGFEESLMISQTVDEALTPTHKKFPPNKQV